MFRLSIIAALLVALCAPVTAQDAPAPGDTAPRLAPATDCTPPVLLPAAHWGSGAARRVALAGPYEMASTATGSLPLRTVRRALQAAAAGAETAALREAAAAYLARLDLEYPRTARKAGGLCPAAADVRVELGYGESRGLHRPGFGYQREFDWTGAFPVDPLSSPAGGTTFVLGLASVAGHFEFMADDDGVALRDGHVAGQLGDVVLWAGRRAINYGPAGSGGIVFAGRTPVTGVGAVVTDPLNLPGFLGFLGPIGMESFFSRARGGERIIDPWLWGARITASPHRRFRIGASRGTMFGGEGNTPVTFRYALQMMMGMHSGEAGEFDNHFGAVDLRYRPPHVPLDLYLEWGMNDSAGAWWAIPARLVGIDWPALPFAPGVGVGAEFARFPRECCGNPIWYRNWSIRMGWTNDGELLGHPLGGHGTELALRTDAVLASGVVVLHGRAFRRNRGDGNMLWPQWGGTSVGAEGSLQVQPGPGAGMVLRGFIETGDDWRGGRLFAGLTWSFGG